MTVTESPSVVDAVRRGLEIHEHTSSDGHRQVRAALTLTTNVERAPAQLWALLTRPDELARWFGPVTGELHEGGRFDAPDGASGSILEIEEPHRISLSWAQGGAEDPLLIQLDPEDDGTTLLRLRHTVLVDAEDFERTGPGALAIGWEIALLALAAHTDGWRGSCLHDGPRPPPRSGGRARRPPDTCAPGRCAGRRRPLRPGSTRRSPDAARRRRLARTWVADVAEPGRGGADGRGVRRPDIFAQAHYPVTDSGGDHPCAALPVEGPAHPGAGAALADPLSLRPQPAGVHRPRRADAGDPAARPRPGVQHSAGRRALCDLRARLVPRSHPRWPADLPDRGPAAHW